MRDREVTRLYLARHGATPLTAEDFKELELHGV